MITPEAERRKAKIREDFEKQRKRILGEIRHRRMLISEGKADYNGKNNRKEIVVLRDRLSALEVQISARITAIDAAKHKIQERKSKDHKWTF